MLFDTASACVALGNRSYTSAGVVHAVAYADLTEGDKLAVVVVELHVGPRRQCDALDKRM